MAGTFIWMPAVGVSGRFQIKNKCSIFVLENQLKSELILPK